MAAMHEECVMCVFVGIGGEEYLSDLRKECPPSYSRSDNLSDNSVNVAAFSLFGTTA